MTTVGFQLLFSTIYNSSFFLQLILQIVQELTRKKPKTHQTLASWQLTMTFFFWCCGIGFHLQKNGMKRVGQCEPETNCYLGLIIVGLTRGDLCPPSPGAKAKPPRSLCFLLRWMDT